MVQGETEVMFIPVAAVDDACLSSAERARADRFRHAADRSSYVAAHVALRQLVGARLDRDPAALSFDTWPCPVCGSPDHGRPRVADAWGLHLSLAHSGGVVAVALSEVGPVGIDVEALDRAVTVADLAAARHPAEPAPADLGEALRSWVRKEAYLKGLGTGLGLDPSSVDLSSDPPGWSIRDLDAPTAYLAALAVQLAATAATGS